MFTAIQVPTAGRHKGLDELHVAGQHMQGPWLHPDYVP